MPDRRLSKGSRWDPGGTLVCERYSWDAHPNGIWAVARDCTRDTRTSNILIDLDAVI